MRQTVQRTQGNQQTSPTHMRLKTRNNQKDARDARTWPGTHVRARRCPAPGPVEHAQATTSKLEVAEEEVGEPPLSPVVAEEEAEIPTRSTEVAEEEAEELACNNLCREREVEEATSNSDLTAEANVPGICIPPRAAVASTKHLQLSSSSQSSDERRAALTQHTKQSHPFSRSTLFNPSASRNASLNSPASRKQSPRQHVELWDRPVNNR